MKRRVGGEMLFARGDLLPGMLKTARDAYRESIQRHVAGKKKFNEEAHLLSYVYEVFGGKDFSANDFIKRIWTDRGVYSTVTGEEGDLTIWHVPAEKKWVFPGCSAIWAAGAATPLLLKRAKDSSTSSRHSSVCWRFT